MAEDDIAESPNSSAPPTRLRCDNCYTEVVGRYCPSCGQDQRSPSFRFFDLTRDALQDFLDADSRFARTLQALLFVPGRITTDYFANRRVRYLPPFRTYLIASVVLFFAYSGLSREVDLPIGANVSPNTFVDPDTLQALSHSASPAERMLAQQIERARQDPIRLLNDIRNRIPQVTIALIPAAAALLWLLFRRPQLRYGHHLIALMHIQSAAFFILILIEALRGWALAAEAFGWYLKPFTSSLDDATAPLVLGHLVWSLRKIYSFSWLSTLMRLLVFMSTYFAFAVIAFGITTFISFLLF